jgi:hypothetical protein
VFPGNISTPSGSNKDNTSSIFLFLNASAINWSHSSGFIAGIQKSLIYWFLKTKRIDILAMI